MTSVCGYLSCIAFYYRSIVQWGRVRDFYEISCISYKGHHSFDVDLHRPKKARGNEKDKLPSGVEPRSNDQQTSTPDTELVCWSLDLGSTPDGSLSFSFPLAFFGLCKSTSKENSSLPSHLRYFNKGHHCNLRYNLRYRKAILTDIPCTYLLGGCFVATEV